MHGWACSNTYLHDLSFLSLVIQATTNELWICCFILALAVPVLNHAWQMCLHYRQSMSRFCYCILNSTIDQLAGMRWHTVVKCYFFLNLRVCLEVCCFVKLSLRDHFFLTELTHILARRYVSFVWYAFFKYQNHDAKPHLRGKFKIILLERSNISKCHFLMIIGKS